MKGILSEGGLGELKKFAMPIAEVFPEGSRALVL